MGKFLNSSFLWLVLVPLAVYANSFLGEFQFDDFSAILENPHLDGWQTFFGHLDHMVRPVLYLTFFSDRVLYGDSAFGYHLTNVGLHLMTGLLVYRIILRAKTEDAPSVAFWSAMIFLVHPLATETVTYLSGRASGLMTFWYLLAFLLYLRGTEQGSREGKDRVWYAAAMPTFFLALGSKEPAVTFPLALLLWDVVVRRLRGRHLGLVFLSNHLPFWIIVLVVAGVGLLKHPQYAYLADFSLGIRPLWDNLLSQIHAVVYAVFLFILPWNQNFDHDLPVFDSVLQRPLPLDFMIVCGLVVAAFFAAPRRPLVAFGLGWFFLQLLPTNSLIPRHDLLSERNLYLPSVGLFTAVMAYGLSFLRWSFRETSSVRWLGKVARSAGLAWVVVLCLLTVQRNALYHDPVQLWSDTVRKSPYKARPHNNLGHSYTLQGNWEPAIEEFRTALTLDPDYPLAQQNLRDAYLFQVGRYE